MSVHEPVNNNLCRQQDKQNEERSSSP